MNTLSLEYWNILDNVLWYHIGDMTRAVELAKKLGRDCEKDMARLQQLLIEQEQKTKGSTSE